MTDYSKITALYSRLSVGDEDRDGGESNSIQNQKIFLENYARGQHLTNIRHYIDDDESGRFFDRSAYSRMMDDVENGKISVCIMKDLTRWGRDYLQVGNAMEIFRRNNVRFIAVNNGIDSEKPDTLEFAPFINIMSEWYAKDISKKVKTGIKTKGMSGKPIVTEAPYGYVKDPDNKDFWIIDEEAAEVVRLIFRLFIGGKNRNQIAVYLTQEQIPTPTFYMKDRGRGTCKNKTLNEDNRCKWNKATLTNILTRQEYCGDVVNFKTTKHFRDKHNHYVDRSQWHITENVHEPIISRSDFETVQRILENAPVKRPNGDGEIHPLSGLLFCKDCGAKMHIRIDYRNGGKRHVAFCSEYHKGKAKNPKCHSPHIMDADLLMQTIAEVLKKIEDYKDNADTIVGNMDSQIFLGGSEPTTLKELSEALGKETIDSYNNSDTRGNSPSYGTNYQKLGHELMSRDELAVLDGGKCILQLRGVRPFLSDKYDLTQHPNYKYTSDYDPKNALDIEKFLNRKEKIHPDDTFIMVDADSLPPA